MRRAARRDEGEEPIVATLRQCGALVIRLNGEDLPDLLVLFRGVTFLLEVKSPPGPRGGTGRKGQRLRPGQREFRDAALARGVEVHEVKSPEDALRAVGIVTCSMPDWAG